MIEVQVGDLFRGGEESFGVGFVDFGEGKGGGSQCSGRFSSDVGARMRCVHLVGCSGRVHILRPLPALMVTERVPDLHEGQSHHQ